jgi:hypothetical protein
MDFDLLDHYLLDGSPAKSEVVRRLLESPAVTPRAAPFYEGMRLLGARTPDLSLMALRLVLEGKTADDASVVQLRRLVERARGGDAAARREYRALFTQDGAGEAGQ